MKPGPEQPSEVFYAWCPCGVADTVYEPGGGPLKIGTLQAFSAAHEGHEGVRYCHVSGLIVDRAPGPDGKYPPPAAK